MLSQSCTIARSSSQRVLWSGEVAVAGDDGKRARGSAASSRSRARRATPGTCGGSSGLDPVRVPGGRRWPRSLRVAVGRDHSHGTGGSSFRSGRVRRRGDDARRAGARTSWVDRRGRATPSRPPTLPRSPTSRAGRQPAGAGRHVARGGLRWSDRREDFRTEVLGLVKAQAVKNAVIVPVGAKGGFVVKQPRATGDAAADRDATRTRASPATSCSSRLLDVTDNVDKVDRRVVPPPEWCAATATTPTSSSPPTRAPPRSPTSPTRWRQTASGWATRSPRADRSATTTRRWASPPRARGNRSSATSARWASTPRPRTSPSSASAT